MSAVDSVDLGWIMAYLVVGLAGLWQVLSLQPGLEARLHHHLALKFFTRLPDAVSYLPYAWLTAAYGLLIIGHSSALPMDFPSLSSGVAVIIAFILVRQILVLSENHRLNNQLYLVLEQVQQQAAELGQTNQELELEIIERKHVEEQLAHDALHDGLTGLANRLLFMDRLDRAIEYARLRQSYSFSVVFLDLDHFKVINDSLGTSLAMSY